jgi:hypothetical protein
MKTAFETRKGVMFMTMASGLKAVLNNIWISVIPPAIALALVTFYQHDLMLTTTIWTVSLLLIGGHASANITTCERIICYVRGPFFLVSALVVLIHGTGLLPLGDQGFRWIFYTVLAGAIVLNLIPMAWEFLRKRTQTE